MNKIFIVLVSLIVFQPYLISAPLKTSIQNSHYFVDESGKAVYLTGSHTWKYFQDSNLRGPSLKFTEYLDFVEFYNHNFIRLWAWEDSGYSPLPYKRTGPGTAFDGGARFDLTQLNHEYFEKLEEGVIAAQNRGIYVGVMLFQGWSGLNRGSVKKWNAWNKHPFNGENNINGIDGSVYEKGIVIGRNVTNLTIPAITSVQEAYVAKVIDTLNQYDNIIWEIGNEINIISKDWQYHMINFIKGYESRKPKQHPVGMTSMYGARDNASLFESSADWVSPFARPWNSERNIYFSDPPIPCAVNKVSILDTDHIGNHMSYKVAFNAKGQRNWTWKAFTRGHNPIYMEAWKWRLDRDTQESGKFPNRANIPNAKHKFGLDPFFDPQRKAMGDTLKYANKMNLAKMFPTNSTAECSTGFCIRTPGIEYIAYQPNATGGITINLPAGSYNVETFDTRDRSMVPEYLDNWNGGDKVFIKPMHASEDWVLYLKVDSLIYSQ